MKHLGVGAVNDRGADRAIFQPFVWNDPARDEIVLPLDGLKLGKHVKSGAKPSEDLENSSRKAAAGSVALRVARVKVGCTVASGDRSGRCHSASVENCCAADRPLPSSRICPLRIVCISSTPPRMICAQRKSLKPCIGRVMRFTERWSRALPSTAPDYAGSRRKRCTTARTPTCYPGESAAAGSRF